MDKSGVFVGGAIGALIVIAIFTVIFIAPPESMKPATVVNDVHASAVIETTPLHSKNLSLIEIFEKAEPGVVRVNVQRAETSERGGVGSGFVFDKKGHVITNAHVAKPPLTYWKINRLIIYL